MDYGRVAFVDDESTFLRYDFFFLFGRREKEEIEFKNRGFKKGMSFILVMVFKSMPTSLTRYRIILY